ncbi:NUDIX domain-containing protein [Hymenobacter sp. GOD-10R]|uniref:NUDIX domain-containing protein n=1 Tax=Hymenobacter sp. GOD-10R TaxID=3093922 RepID=UPI002D78B64E|nr:NUDIX domain-containing protein [Hymenobacter sp. GOD-10R]WRQ30199.1 NUDIX domain-containing protein [Hymenobacter sp. GOD-10R]
MSTSFTPNFLGAYTNQVRVRVCGLLVHEGAILLTAHRGLLPDEALFWSPPGGGWQFGESVQECLQREFLEETGLAITPGRFLHLHEFGGDQLQALELFFAVAPTDPKAVPQLGADPEHAADAQLLTKLAFIAPRQLVKLPPHQVHPVLRHIISPDDLYIPQIRFK